MKVEYKPICDCCNHYKTNLFTVGYQANPRTGKPSNFKVYICDNCGEVHDDYDGIKGLLSILYFKCISKGCIYIDAEDEVEDEQNDRF